MWRSWISILPPLAACLTRARSVCLSSSPFPLHCWCDVPPFTRWLNFDPEVVIFRSPGTTVSSTSTCWLTGDSTPASTDSSGPSETGWPAWFLSLGSDSSTRENSRWVYSYVLFTVGSNIFHTTMLWIFLSNKPLNFEICGGGIYNLIRFCRIWPVFLPCKYASENRMLSCECVSFLVLQVLISGAEVPIDINDLRANTKYAGIYVHKLLLVEAVTCMHYNGPSK